MKTIRLKKLALLVIMLIASKFSYAQEHKHTKLHIADKWDQCSFQLHPSLTQSEWHKFTREAGLVAYFRPITDAKPLGKRHFEISLMEWKTKLDDSEGAWNNTFVHPDSTHWLKDGARLGVPGLSGRYGLTDKIDLGVYVTKNPKANYGVFGAQVQYNFQNDTLRKWSASTRATFSTLFGPEDLRLNIYGVDLLASKSFNIYANRIFISPYAGISTYLSSTKEVTDKVNLKNESILGAQAMLGFTTQIYKARIGIEYNFASRSTFSYKIGLGF